MNQMLGKEKIVRGFTRNITQIKTEECWTTVSFYIKSLLPSINMKEIRKITREEVKSKLRKREIHETLIWTSDFIINES